MKKILFGFVIIGLLAAGLMAAASVHADDDYTISVIGKGVVNMKPDIVNVQLGVMTEKESITEAIDTNTNAVVAIKNAILALGVADNDIKTDYYNLYSSQMSYRDASAPADAYIYSISYGFSIVLRDVNRLNEVLDAAVQNGANSIHSVSYDSSVKDKVIADARNLAIDDAKMQAQAIADKLGVTLKEVVSFSVPDYQDYMYPGGGMGYGGGGGSAPISSGDLSITMKVNMSFAYEVQ
jgi:uncharacterized protein YggE